MTLMDMLDIIDEMLTCKEEVDLRRPTGRRCETLDEIETEQRIDD